jgi:hypothetical protein
VTVIIPTYNYGRYLRECCMSVLQQESVDVKVLIVDDASSDETADVCDALCEHDGRVSVIQHSRNRGMIASVNEGLDAAAGDYIVKLDADDLLAVNALPRALALLEARPDVSFVYGLPHHFSGAAPDQNSSATNSWTIWHGRCWLWQRSRRANNVISQPEVVIRTAALRAVGGVNAELPHTSDLNLWLRLASIGAVGRINGPVQGYYRVHSDSMQQTVHSGDLLRLEGRIAAFEMAFDSAPAGLHDVEELRATARQAVAKDALRQASHRYDRGRVAAHDDHADDLAEFAIRVWPDAKRSREWSAFRRRKQIGPDRAPGHPRFVADALTRRLRFETERWWWQRTGEW